MVKIGDVEESGKSSVSYTLKCRVPYGVKTCRSSIWRAEELYGKNRVLKRIIHSSNRNYHNTLGTYLLEVTKMRKVVLRDLI
jgi:hypothetical protein